jgi:NhaP-type Na+/H+ or K+/H+ antiporter
MSAREVKGMLPSARWRAGPAVLAFALGVALGRPGFHLLQPQLTEDGGLIESVSEGVLLVCLFCVGLRLQVPFEWSRWRIPVRLATVSMLVTLVLTAGAAAILFDLDFIQALLLATILSPTDAVLGSEPYAGAMESEPESSPSFALAAEGAFSSGLALPLTVLVLGLMGLEDKSSPSLAWVLLTGIWSAAGGLVAGWLIGAGMARWIALLDFDRQTDLLEVMVVFATAALAYGGAVAMHASGFIAVLAAGLALAHGGRLRPSMRKRTLAPRVLRIAARTELLATLCVVVLLGAMSPEMDFHVRVVVFGVLLLALVRPCAVRLGLSGLGAPPALRRSLEWIGVRGAAAVYCLVFAINHGLSAPVARQLAGIALLVIAGSIVAHGVSATPPQRVPQRSVSG